jgi:ribose 1,5-bisphosphokinase
MSAEHAPGTMIVVVGPSGAGKDTLLDYARQRLAGEPDIGFVRRFITRDSAAGGEDHSAVTVAEFETLRNQGAFAVSWGAHGLFYGVPANTSARIALGGTLVVNGSRAAVPEFLKAYSKVVAISITARPEIIAERLAARGRESAEEIRKRLARATEDWQGNCECISIDNSGAIEDAGEALLNTIISVAQRSEFSAPLAGQAVATAR